MDPLTGGLIAGGISALGSIFSTNQNNANSQALLQQQEAYQTQMSNTAYQRASADMKAAGLNPMMMFGSGSAASSPGAPAAQPQKSPLQGVSDSVDKVVSSAVQMKTIDKMTEEIAKLKTAEGLDEAHSRVAGVEAGQRAIQAGLSEAETRRIRASMPVTVDEALSASNRSKMDPTARRLLDQMGFAGRKVDDVLSPVGNLASSASGIGRMIKSSQDNSFRNRYYFGE